MKKTHRLVLAAFMLALGLVLPFFTGQIPQIGSMLLPMHIPVLLCGLLCGWRYGVAAGFLTPLLRSALFGMPVAFPVAPAMAVELMVYGGMAGFLYGRSPWKCMISLYRALGTALIAGRFAWGGAMATLLGGQGQPFTWAMFFSGAVVNAIPGIILQLVAIPVLMLALNRTGLVHFYKHKKACIRCDY